MTQSTCKQDFYATYPKVSYLYGVGIRLEQHLYIFNVFLSLGSWLGQLISSLTSTVLKLGTECRRVNYSSSHTIYKYEHSRSDSPILPSLPPSLSLCLSLGNFFISPMVSIRRGYAVVGRPVQHQSWTSPLSQPVAKTASSYSASSAGP